MRSVKLPTAISFSTRHLGQFGRDLFELEKRAGAAAMAREVLSREQMFIEVTLALSGDS
jgi:antitoxin component HigA of HigAB toxin-antitoxin module